LAIFRLDREQAELEAESLVESEWAGHGLPINCVYIAKQLGAEVYEMALKDDVDGMLKYFEGGASPAILVRQDSAPARKRFTVAHELGHLVMNRRMHPEEELPITDIFYRNMDSRTAQKPEEIFANQFAAALLMPRKFVRVLVDSGKSDLVMASDFGVSLQAMTHRLNNLGLKPKTSSS
jgi:Zn-dependent peptidase ImmA (M78 family)